MSSMIPPIEKRCPRCETVKPASAFNRSDRTKDGLADYCKPCAWQMWSSRNQESFPEGHKRCSSCHEVKSFDQFFHEKRTRDGYGYECKPCHKERHNRLVSLYEPTAERVGSKRGTSIKRHPKEDLPEGYKRCLKCDEVKLTSAFPKRLKNSDGIYSYCKECSNKRKLLPVIIPESKQCPKCGEVKPSDEFYIALSAGHNGLRSTCKECDKITAKVPYSYVKRRRGALREYYGMTLEEYEAMLEAQEGKCAACGYPETMVMHGKVIPLAVDHSRVTGGVRGLLCTDCNRALGMLKEDPERVEGLLRYIKERVLY